MDIEAELMRSWVEQRERLRGDLDARLGAVRDELMKLEVGDFAGGIADELERSFAMWKERAKVLLAAVRLTFAGQELAPWVATDVMASGYGGVVEREGRPRFTQLAFDCCGGFAIVDITGSLADLGDDDEISELEDFDQLREALHAFSLVATAQALRQACSRPAFAAVPRADELIFFAARHDEDPVVVWRG
jgi:hypothetical protein